MELPDIFLITSVINTGNKEWSYAKTRSFFTEEERFHQTIETIDSIRKLNDNSLILLVECSDLDEKHESALMDKVDIYIQTFKDDAIRDACLNSKKKGYGELLKCLEAVRYIRENHIKFKRIFKISGRYWLNNQFDKNNFSTEKFTFNAPLSGGTCNPTVMYSIPYNLLFVYNMILEDCDDFLKKDDCGYEYLLPPKCIPKTEIHRVGVSGRVAVDNTLYES
jgi:hypothetical protein